MKRKEVWTGKHKDITYTIEHFETYNNRKSWTFYLWIRLKQLPKGIASRFWLTPHKRGKRIYYDYYKEPLISDIKFHCGCTWYSKELGFDGEQKTIKIGCDYSHLYDEGRQYCISDLEYDVKEAINSLYDMIPNIKHWCNNCGKYGVRGYTEEGNGYYVCNDCKEEK